MHKYVYNQGGTISPLLLLQPSWANFLYFDKGSVGHYCSVLAPGGEGQKTP